MVYHTDLIPLKYKNLSMEGQENEFGLQNYENHVMAIVQFEYDKIK